LLVIVALSQPKPLGELARAPQAGGCSSWSPISLAVPAATARTAAPSLSRAMTPSLAR
jgi:hypothetical protein